MIAALALAALLAGDGPAPVRSPSPRPAASPRPPAPPRALASPSPSPAASPRPAAASPAPSASPRVYTNEDLPERAEGEETSPEDAPPTPDPALVNENPRTPADELGGSRPSGAGEEFWRERAREARQAIVDADAEVARIEARIAEVRTDANPTSNVTTVNREQARQDELRQLHEELEVARARAEAARKALAALEEEARRAAVPPGWLR